MMTVQGVIKDMEFDRGLVDQPFTLGTITLEYTPPAVAKPVTVRFKMERDEYSKVAILTPGQEVRVRAQLDADSTDPKGDRVTMVSGRVDWAGPNPVARLTSVELRDIARDAAAADQKYKGKWVSVAGVVQEKTEGGAGGRSTIVIVQPKVKGVVVVAFVYPSTRNDFDQLKVGDKVSVKGRYEAVEKGQVVVAAGWQILR